jgi:hypothetical protein
MIHFQIMSRFRISGAGLPTVYSMMACIVIILSLLCSYITYPYNFSRVPRNKFGNCWSSIRIAGGDKRSLHLVAHCLARDTRHGYPVSHPSSIRSSIQQEHPPSSKFSQVGVRAVQSWKLFLHLYL